MPAWFPGMVICFRSRTKEGNLSDGSTVVVDLTNGILHPRMDGRATRTRLRPDRMVLKENIVPPFGKGSLYGSLFEDRSTASRSGSRMIGDPEGNRVGRGNSHAEESGWKVNL